MAEEEVGMSREALGQLEGNIAVLAKVIPFQVGMVADGVV